SRQAVGRTGIGLAVREGAKRPDIATADTFMATLLNAHSIALSDPSVGGSAGTYLAGLFERMGVSQDLKEKVLPQRSGGGGARPGAESRAEICFAQIND